MNLEERDLYTVLGTQPGPALAVRGGTVVYANQEAAALFYPRMTGKPAAEFLEPAFLEPMDGPRELPCQVEGRSFTARLLDMGDLRTVTLFPREEPQPETEAVAGAVSFATRDSLGVCRAVLDLMESRARESSDILQLQYTAAMSKAVHRITRMADNCDRLFRGVGLRPETELTDLTALAEDLVATVNSLMTQRQPQVQVSAPGGPVLCRCDSQLLELALMNLLSNSLKFGGDRVNVTVTLRPAGSSALLTVSDDGPGIAPEDQRDVFGTYRHPRAVAAAGTGAGLGLALVQRIAEAHGGSALLESRPGQGTSVTLRLPGREEAANVLHAAPNPRRSPADLFLSELSDVLDVSVYQSDI